MTEQAGSPQREGSSVVVKVLYIEDNDDDVYMLKMRLELLGNFEVLTAADGEKGCEVAAAEQPDIILMDIEMPVVDGWEAAHRLKGNPQTQDIPIRHIGSVIYFTLIHAESWFPSKTTSAQDKWLRLNVSTACL